MMETAEEGGDNLETGGFGKVHLHRRVMSACHLDSSFTATSHADSPLMRQERIHTSHCSMVAECASGVFCTRADEQDGLRMHI